MEDPTKVLIAHSKVLMNRFASWLNKVFRGKLKPSHITTISLLGHVPIVWALIDNQPVLAAVLLIFFGLMDALDGALARVQGSESSFGMFYDAVTDRLKEIFLYCGLAIYVYTFVGADNWLIVALAGSSLLVSYVKAKGEMAVTSSKHDKQELNRAFSGGISRYEIRMTMIIIGLTVGFLVPIIRLVIALNLYTFAVRFIDISTLLADEKKKHAKN